MRLPQYGKLDVKNLDKRAYRMWLTRNDELPPCEPFGWGWQYETDPEDSRIVRDLMHKLVSVTPMTVRQELVIQLIVLEGCTLEETGLELGVTGARAREILNKVLRKLRWNFERNPKTYLGYDLDLRYDLERDERDERNYKTFWRLLK
jgi:hypothetical protein